MRRELMERARAGKRSSGSEGRGRSSWDACDAGPSMRARLQVQAEAMASVTEAGTAPSAGPGCVGLPGHREGHDAECGRAEVPEGAQGRLEIQPGLRTAWGLLPGTPGGTAGTSPPRGPCRLRHRPVSKFRADPGRSGQGNRGAGWRASKEEARVPGRQDHVAGPEIHGLTWRHVK